MNSTDLSPKSVQALDNLRALASKIRETNRGVLKKATVTEKEAWVQKVATLFADSKFDVDEMRKELWLLPPAVLGAGVATAWAAMDEQRREAHIHALSSLSSERSGPQLVVLIPRLIDEFPADALRLFLSVSVDNREQRDRLAVDILTPERLAGLLQPASPEWQVLKLVKKLITLTESPKATGAGRFAVVGSCVRAATEHKLDSDWREVASQLRGLISSLPEAHQRSLMTSVPPDRREWYMELLGQPHQAGAHPGSGTVGPVPVAPPTGVDEPSPAPKQASSTATVKSEESAIADDLDTDLAILLAGLQRQVATIERAERELAVLRRERLDLRFQLDQAQSERARAVEEAQSAKRNLEDSRERMAQRARELGERDRLAAKRLEEAQQKAAEREREVARQREEFAADRAAWIKRVEVNANGRLAEFRNALGESLSRVIGNLPPRNSPASLDLCALLLTRLYEILSELERKDIHVKLG